MRIISHLLFLFSFFFQPCASPLKHKDGTSSALRTIGLVFQLDFKFTQISAWMFYLGNVGEVILGEKDDLEQHL